FVVFLCHCALSPRSTLFPYTTLFRSRCRPLVERIRRLHVVVVIDKKSSFAAAGLADDCRRSPIDRERFGGDAAAFFRPVEDDPRSEEHTSELQSQSNLVCRLLLEKKK